MSLHLGNLSSRVRRDELERVFRRFGRCNVQVKDKFGFVVYDIPVNAEKALRTLRGKNICGEPITVSWSNRQPRPLQRFARGGRSYESQRGRNSVREDYGNRKLGSDGRRDNIMGFKQPADDDGNRFNPAELVDEATSYNIKGYKGEKDLKLREDLPNEGAAVEPNFLNSDRWGEQVDDLSNENGVENGFEFERYEPHHGDDSRDEDEIHHIAHSGGSPALQKSQEKKKIEQIGETTLNHPDNTKYRQTCYICGELGHKMRNCPQKNASHREKLSRFDRMRDNKINFRGKGEGNLKRLRSKSRGRDDISLRKLSSDRKAPSSRRHHRLIDSGHSPVERETHGSQRNEYGEKKRSRREIGSPERHRAKKSRGPVSSPIHSDYTASRSESRSKSSKYASMSSLHSRLRSVSSRSGSLYSNSRSGSSSYYSRSRGFKSKSRSRSSSPTSLSLSVSLGRPLPSSPNKVQINQKNSLVNAVSPESKEGLVELGQLVEGDAGSDNSKLENMTIGVENGSAVKPFKVDEDMDNDHSQKRNDDNRAIFRDTCEVENSCNWLLEKGDLTARSLSPHSLREKRELQNSDVRVTEMEHMLTPTKNLESEVSVKSRTANSTSITSEELYTVLKHYGLDHAGKNEKNLPVEAYFGSARLWPWEIIYYRRLKKGPISIENYARRIAQNKEFDIVDKYIRSSSGWGEIGHDNS